MLLCLNLKQKNSNNCLFAAYDVSWLPQCWLVALVSFLMALCSTSKHSKTDAKQIVTKWKQVHDLRKVQEDLIYSRCVHMEFYRKVAKHKYTAELNNLIRGEFNRVDVELKIPKLPPDYPPREEYTSMLQVEKMIDIVDVMNSSVL
ncbi:uncharacterized protein LOC117574145 isoform X2 [Drosophila albomicans]|uniref:Uncharacterized protein LOC117574145 isoform X2 n=1 Tax=Drosophila albomicans TaxID=7291 RepID=A0A6P8ZBA0_DROAB|nr:uncharacterized protein LOC117574145 isoform X2 [Drosophila albomicans]